MPDEHFSTSNQPRFLPVYVSLGFVAYFVFLLACNHFALEFRMVDLITEFITLPLLVGMGLFLLMNLWWLVRGGPSGRTVYTYSVVILLLCLGILLGRVL